MKSYYYPNNLTVELLARWPATAAGLLPLAELEDFISVAYQASLLHEEGHPVRCRLVLSALEHLPKGTDPSESYVLELAAPRPYTEQEIRRLSPALDSPGSLLAVCTDPEAGLLIWGLLRSRNPWHETDTFSPVPAQLPLILDVSGPGNLVFYHGRYRVLTLQHGHVEGHGFVEYPVAWSHGRFTENIEVLRPQLVAAGVDFPADLMPLLGELAHHVTRRVVARVRASGHGGMLAYVPTASVARCVGLAATLRPKYPVRLPDEAHFYNGLQLAIIGRLAELGDVSWRRYQQAGDTRLLELEASLDQYAHLLADLMSVDGALVVTKQLAIVGFGIEVYAPQLALSQVYRALDATATRLQAEPADSGGTRHRAAYRLCLAEPESMAIVISQDGGVRFVQFHEEKAVFWEQLTL
ncbi:putative sensor domain DACNV-containing protein [Hymenobacter coccineus]|uniref:Probable sensor domain-containing protein n=1 Tax=Hymenobacter coccineus TaxID=1908235 RepID=A0A1G1SU45_9BACT|nr:hypothetical protein [Hymenobacter coccineus]OGX82116.1 hypothetical protein BEN49_02910 [Hymenobacter coccineus]